MRISYGTIFFYNMFYVSTSTRMPNLNPVHSRDEHVVGDVVQVTSVLEPWAGHADVVRGALAVDL